MPSNYTGDGAVFTDTIPLCVDSDAPSAQLLRVPVERVLDNTAYLKALAHSAHLSLRVLSADTINTRCLVIGANNLSSLPFALVFRATVSDGQACEVYLPAEGGFNNTSTPVSGVAFRGVASQNADLSGRIAAVNDSANPLHFSDDFGSTWTAVSAANSFGANPGLDIAYNGTRWMAICETTSNAIFSSTTAAASTWTSRSLNGTAGDLPKRFASSRTSGRTIVIGTNAAATAPFMAESADGITWSAVTLPSGVNDTEGDVKWHPDGYFFWVCTTDLGLARLYRSPDTGAAVWTRVDSSLISTMNEMAIDQTTGVMYLCGQRGAQVGGLAMSTDLGESWVYVPSMLTSVAAANGCLFGINAGDDTLFASSPITLGSFS